ncbi:MAG TPA: hypothetical protein VGL91_17020 [Acidobacteriota bacterium]|jgi:hypothetical protein
MQRLARDLTVNLQEDRPGMLAKAIEAVAKADINIDGFAEIDGILHLLAKDAAAMRQALEAAGFHADERPVLVIDAQDRTGVAADIFRRIADSGVNVNFTYVSNNNRIVIAASDLKKVADLLPVKSREVYGRIVTDQ